MYTMKLCQQTEARNLEDIFWSFGFFACFCLGSWFGLGGFLLFFILFFLLFFKKKMVALGFIAISLQPVSGQCLSDKIY